MARMNRSNIKSLGAVIKAIKGYEGMVESNRILDKLDAALDADKNNQQFRFVKKSYLTEREWRFIKAREALGFTVPLPS